MCRRLRANEALGRFQRVEGASRPKGLDQEEFAFSLKMIRAGDELFKRMLMLDGEAASTAFDENDLRALANLLLTLQKGARKKMKSIGG